MLIVQRETSEKLTQVLCPDWRLLYICRRRQFYDHLTKGTRQPSAWGDPLEGFCSSPLKASLFYWNHVIAISIIRNVSINMGAL
jgi:hypothetical protein